MIYGLLGQDVKLRVTCCMVAVVLLVRGFFQWRELLWPAAAILLLHTFGEKILDKIHPFPAAILSLLTVGGVLLLSGNQVLGTVIVLVAYLTVIGLASGFLARVREVVRQYLAI